VAAVAATPQAARVVLAVVETELEVIQLELPELAQQIEVVAAVEQAGLKPQIRVVTAGLE
jgi:hypothetical protein